MEELLRCELQGAAGCGGLGRVVGETRQGKQVNRSSMSEMNLKYEVKELNKLGVR